jgi:hypothetical protein
MKHPNALMTIPAVLEYNYLPPEIEDRSLHTDKVKRAGGNGKGGARNGSSITFPHTFKDPLALGGGGQQQRRSKNAQEEEEEGEEGDEGDEEEEDEEEEDEDEEEDLVGGYFDDECVEDDDDEDDENEAEDEEEGQYEDYEPEKDDDDDDDTDQLVVEEDKEETAAARQRRRAEAMHPMLMIGGNKEVKLKTLRDRGVLDQFLLYILQPRFRNYTLLAHNASG